MTDPLERLDSALGLNAQVREDIKALGEKTAKRIAELEAQLRHGVRCDECKHWSRGDEHGEQKQANGLVVRRCQRAPEWWEATAWVDSDDPCNVVRSLKPEHSGTKMFVQDGSDYVAYLYTAADFFCAHHEPAT